MADDMEASFAECGVFVRDTRLSHEVLRLYRPGILLREPTFCDASYQLGGFAAPHRFLIFSANAKAFPAENPWAMVVWLRGRIFKVIDRVSDSVRTQIALLEVPEHLVGAFLGDAPNGIEQDFSGHARSIFEQLSNAPAVPALDTDRWRERLTYPVGVDDAGRYFRLYEAEDWADGASRQRRCLAVGYQARVLANAGALRDAEAVLQQSVEGLREFDAEAGDALVSLLSAAADLRMQLGAYRQAEADLHEAFGLAKQLAEDRLPVAAILNRLGHLYQREGRLDAAERFYLHALKIKRRVAGERSAEVVTTLVSLAALYERQAAFTKAKEYLVEAQAAAEAAGVPVDAVLFNNLGRLQQATGRYDEALHNLRSALALSEMDYLQHMALLNNLAELYAARGDATEALGLYAEVLGRQREIIDQIGASRTSEHLLDLLGTSRSTLDQYISLVLSESATAAAEHTEHLADLVLQRKCLGMDTFAGKRDILRQATEPGLADEVRRLATMRQQIAEARLAGRDPTDKGSFVDDLLRLTDAADALESAIAGKVPQLAARLNNSRITSTDVTNAVPAGSTLVEIIRYSRLTSRRCPPATKRHGGRRGTSP